MCQIVLFVHANTHWSTYNVAIEWQRHRQDAVVRWKKLDGRAVSASFDKHNDTCLQLVASAFVQTPKSSSPWTKTWCCAHTHDTWLLQWIHIFVNTLCHCMFVALSRSRAMNAFILETREGKKKKPQTHIGIHVWAFDRRWGLTWQRSAKLPLLHLLPTWVRSALTQH